MHRFFIFPPDEINQEKVLITSDELTHQFNDVLRFKKGEQVIILDNTGYEYLTEISDISKKSILGKVLQKTLNGADPSKKICLFMSLLKNQEKFEMVLQKGTEVGVSEFIPVITKRTEQKFLHKVERLNRILKEAAEQSGRGFLPVLQEPIKLEKVFEGSSEDKNNATINLLAHTGGERGVPDLKNVSIMNIFIGPEGGFDDSEIEMAKKTGFTIVTFGKTVLRAETAGMVIPFFVSNLY